MRVLPDVRVYIARKSNVRFVVDAAQNCEKLFSSIDLAYRDSRSFGYARNATSPNSSGQC